MKFTTAIIDPVPVDALKSELTADKLLRTTNFGANEIYSINHHTAPNVMLEIGRLREFTFRSAGGGTGKATDIDTFDTAPEPYQQLVVWDPESDAILGGYRYIFCKDAPKDKKGQYQLATTELFNFSKAFNDEYCPYVLELGRSFVHPDYQSGKKGRKGMFALDNLWDGLGALIVDNRFVKYFYGKVTMYRSFDKYARDLILYFMNKHFRDKENLLFPIEPLAYHTPVPELENVFTKNTYKENHKILSQMVRSRGVTIPPLINSYMNLSPDMRCFGTALNRTFGEVEETGILITIDNIYKEKKERHISSYIQYLKERTLNC